MSNGIFGSVRPAILNPSEDVDILYYYRPSRGEVSDNFSGFKELDASECLIPAVTASDNTEITGLFTLRLPVEYFNEKGFYTIYIRPKEREATILDVSTLATDSSVKGVVFNLANSLTGISDLTGYRIEFSDGTTRIIKSSNRCEPVVVNTADGNPKATRYNLTDTSSSLVFCTVTPSSAPSFRVNAAPYIGRPNETVKIVNTKFNPKMIEVEMTTHDMDTLSYMLEGDQATDRDNAIITTYNDKHEIYHQSDYYTLKDSLGNPIYNVKRRRDAIDNNQKYDNILD